MQAGGRQQIRGKERKCDRGEVQVFCYLPQHRATCLSEQCQLITVVAATWKLDVIRTVFAQSVSLLGRRSLEPTGYSRLQLITFQIIQRSRKLRFYVPRCSPVKIDKKTWQLCKNSHRAQNWYINTLLQIKFKSPSILRLLKNLFKVKGKKNWFFPFFS